MIYAQGDILIELVEQNPQKSSQVGMSNNRDVGRDTCIDADGSVVLARGEVTGHRHRFSHDSGVTLFRDDALAHDIPTGLYIGHIKIDHSSADLVHEEHGTIRLKKGTYRIRRQREFDAGEAKIVED